ncbi:VTC domain-containing protein [Halteromyces radiatus]|uniref:VTC domain-containing protein n=1 Tax=Halteromyces radiatus TaxID=101107 RepID=UPI00221E4C41|nr:VTC domain-containing protein [Halteromyces radiatus]KAI8083044.1 VTC domain-containing protein [Halteromyces radiatus]
MVAPIIIDVDIQTQSFDSLFQQIPNLLISQHKIHLVHLSDILAIYNQDTTLDSLKQELYRLRFSIWRFFYLDYENLIKSSNFVLYYQFEPQYQISFFKTFIFELNKVHDFCTVKGGEIDRRLTFINCSSSSIQTLDSYMDMRDTLDELTYDIQDLWHFIKLNYRAFLAIVYHLDTAIENNNHQQYDRMKTNLFLQKLYRLLLPHQFLDLDLFLRWALDLGELYRHRLYSGCTDLQLATTCMNDVGNYFGQSDLLSLSDITSPITYLTKFDMTGDFYNISTYSLPSTDLPQAAMTLSIPPPPSSPISGPTTCLDHLSPTSSSYSDRDSFCTGVSSHQSQIDETTVHSNNSDDNIDDHSTCSTGNTLKFWIHPDNILEVIMYLAKFMEVTNHYNAFYPAAKYEIDNPEHIPHHDDALHQQYSASKNERRHGQYVTTIHLDTPDLSNYTQHVTQCNDDPSLTSKGTIAHLRLRQYHNGSVNNNDESATVKKSDNDSSTTTFYALEKKVYMSNESSSSVLPSPPNSRAMSTVDRNKKLGKKPYYYQQYQRRYDRPSSTTIGNDINNQGQSLIPACSATSIITNLSSDATTMEVDNFINDDDESTSMEQLQHYGNIIPSHYSSMLYSRIWIKSKRCKPWLNHQWSLLNILDKSSSKYPHRYYYYKKYKNCGTDEELVEQKVMEMEQDLRALNLIPVLKSSYNRMGFKWKDQQNGTTLSGNGCDDQQYKQMTITIDTDITMAPYDINQVMKGTPAYQDDYPCITLPPNSVTRFPFAVIQINLSQDLDVFTTVKSSSPTTASLYWFKRFLSCPLLEPVQDFSLYLHGISTLLPNKAIVHPHWHKKLKWDLRRTDNQGYLSGMGRTYHQDHHHHRQRRQRSNKSSSQDSTNDATTAPWSFCNTTLTASSSKSGKNIPDRNNIRASTPEPMSTTNTSIESTKEQQQRSSPSDHYKKDIENGLTSSTTSSRQSMDFHNDENDSSTNIKLTIQLSSPRYSPSERTPLLEITSRTSLKDDYCCLDQGVTSTKLQSDNYPTRLPPTSQDKGIYSSSYSSSRILRMIFKIWLHLTTLFDQPDHFGMNGFNNEQEIDYDHQQHQHNHLVINVLPESEVDNNDRKRTSNLMTHTIATMKRPIPLTMLCGIGSFMVAFVLYLLVDDL